MQQGRDSGLTGTWRVMAMRSARDDVWRLMGRMRDVERVRRHAIKLRFWPESHPTDEHGTVLDLNWSWIKSLPKQRVGELRIQEHIGGHDNLRLIFFVGDPAAKNPLPMIWILAAMQKKRDDFTTANIAAFEARRRQVMKRFFEG